MSRMKGGGPCNDPYIHNFFCGHCSKFYPRKENPKNRCPECGLMVRMWGRHPYSRRYKP